ncbi:MAG: hypothetical protein R2847_04625 [Bacteroidia bacterium]
MQETIQRVKAWWHQLLVPKDSMMKEMKVFAGKEKSVFLKLSFTFTSDM